MSQYDLRDLTLKRLGLGNYPRYLRSDLWESIRYMVWERDGGTCQACGRRGHSTHHRNYRGETLLGEDLSGLILLCKGCHRRIEFKGRYKVMCPKEVDLRLQSMLNSKGKSTGKTIRRKRRHRRKPQ